MTWQSRHDYVADAWWPNGSCHWLQDNLLSFISSKQCFLICRSDGKFSCYGLLRYFPQQLPLCLEQEIRICSLVHSSSKSVNYLWYLYRSSQGFKCNLGIIARANCTSDSESNSCLLWVQLFPNCMRINVIAINHILLVLTSNGELNSVAVVTCKAHDSKHKVRDETVKCRPGLE